MKKLIYLISRIFFSREKLLLIRLLNIIQDNLVRSKDGSVVKMSEAGMCFYIRKKYGFTEEETKILLRLINKFKPKSNKTFGTCYFEPENYEVRLNFLKTLIKKF